RPVRPTRLARPAAPGRRQEAPRLAPPPLVPPRGPLLLLRGPVCWPPRPTRPGRQPAYPAPAPESPPRGARVPPPRAARRAARGAPAGRCPRRRATPERRARRDAAAPGTLPPDRAGAAEGPHALRPSCAAAGGRAPPPADTGAWAARVQAAPPAQGPASPPPRGGPAPPAPSARPPRVGRPPPPPSAPAPASAPVAATGTMNSGSLTSRSADQAVGSTGASWRVSGLQCRRYER